MCRGDDTSTFPLPPSLQLSEEQVLLLQGKVRALEVQLLECEYTIRQEVCREFQEQLIEIEESHRCGGRGVRREEGVEGRRGGREEIVEGRRVGREEGVKGGGCGGRDSEMRRREG